MRQRNPELLKRLAEQAHVYAAEQWGKQREGEVVYDPHVFESKFAELIVAECVRECRFVERLHSSSNISDFDRDQRSGRQIGASLCAERLRDLFTFN